ncbi:MAG: biotin--[acetyl-CoA-carboxylase] ligase [Bergeyella sp.]|nr:biotin--[acetyl-CoA-carboxylase] ligase [Bergeyella sp.]
MKVIPLHYVSECESTNDDVLGFLEPRNPSAALYCFCQTRARGQYGNVWYTPKNENIAYSLALEESLIDASHLSSFNFYTAILIRKFIAKMAERRVWIKWPNDIILNNKKIAGILIEQAKTDFGKFYVLGVGVNVLQKTFGSLSKASSLSVECGKKFDLHDFSKKLHGFLSSYITKIPSVGELLDLYHRFLYKKDQVSVFLWQGQPCNGIIKKVDTEGFLWIEMEDGKKYKFFHKEIEMTY